MDNTPVVNHRRPARIMIVACAALVLVAVTMPAGAQLSGSSGWGAKVTMEPIILAYGGFGALCNPRAAGRAGWGVDQIAKLVKPTEPQRAALDNLRAAATTAVQFTEAVCPRQIPRSSRDRMTFMEHRLAALLQATKAVIPAFEAYYASLSDEQKTQLDAGPRRWRR